MHKLSRSLFAGFVAMGTLVACDDVETTPPAPQVTAVNVVPANVQVSVGGTATLAATVVGDAGLTDRTVTWRSSNTAVATVDASGTVRGVAAGQTTIIAASNADPNVQGAAAVVVTPLAVPAVSIASITKNGLPVDINNVQGQVDVTLNVASNGAAVSGVDLLVKCPNNAAPVLVQGQTFAGNTAPNGPITLSFNSARLNAAGTGPEFTNGACQVTARLNTPSGAPTAQDVVLPITLQNQDVIIAAVTTSKGPAADQAGQAWRGGDVTVRVTPVLYSGQTANSVTVTLTGTDTDGTAFTRTQTVTGTFPQNVVFPGTGSGATSVAGVTVPNVQVNATAAGANNIVITPTATQTTVFNLDNEAPAAGTYAFNTQGTQNFWAGNAYVFNTTAGNGYTAAVTAPGGNDWGGVDRVTVVYEAAPIDTRTQTCASSQTGLTFTAVTAASQLASSQVQGRTPFGPSYCLRMVETDALGNARTTYIGVFGVDRENPAIIRTGGLANNSSFDINGTDDVPGDAFPVAGNQAAAAAATYTFTLRDTLSGFDATPINYSITRLTAAGTACVIGGASCAPTDDASQTVAVSGTDRVATVLATGGSTVEGYYTFNGVARDQAANVSTALPTRMSLVDATAPTVGGVSLPATIAGNTTASFTTSAADNLDLYLAQSVITYPAATIRSTDQQIGTPFDATLTRSVNPLNATFANFYRSLSTNSTVAGAKPTAVQIRAIDAATNVSTPNAGTGEGYATIPAANVPNSTFTFFSAGLLGFTFTGPTTACQAGSACTLTVQVAGASGTFTNPFAGVNLYYLDGATNELVPLNATPLTSAAQTDNGVNRFYTYTFSTSALPTGAVSVYAIGFNANGDALLTGPLGVNNPAPAP